MRSQEVQGLLRNTKTTEYFSKSLTFLSSVWGNSSFKSKFNVSNRVKINIWGSGRGKRVGPYWATQRRCLTNLRCHLPCPVWMRFTFTLNFKFLYKVSTNSENRKGDHTSVYKQIIFSVSFSFKSWLKDELCKCTASQNLTYKKINSQVKNGEKS